MNSQEQSSKTIVVVGGVAAGASLAARARRLDENATIVVLERGRYVSFANCGLPYHVGGVIAERERLLLQTPQSLRESLDIDVRIGAEVIDLDRVSRRVRVREVATGDEYTLDYDSLALCTGSEPIRPALQGIDLPGVMVLRDLQDMDAIMERIDGVLQSPSRGDQRPAAVVVGAGYIGVEMAENLHQRGFAVSIVESADHILPVVDREIAAPVEDHLRSRGVDLHLSMSAAAFVPAGERLAVELTSAQTLEADLVLLAVGVRPAAGLARTAGLDIGERGGIVVDAHMRTSDPHVWAAGDVVESAHAVLPGSRVIPLAGPANRQGRVAAENICGRTTQYRSTLATSSVKVFDMAVGGTGATERQLREAGIASRAVHLHPADHAGYYPGASMMHLKVLFDPQDGRVLGAQACGFGGIDKRLDVLAMAVRAQMTVFDLEEAELCYAPPFGSAKDPVNMAGFIAANTLHGDLTLWYAEEFTEIAQGTRLIDVRTAEEFAMWHLPGAENVPLARLREASRAWDPSVPVRLYCAVGFRSYLAHRVLVQRGFADVRTLSGGSTTFRAWHEVPGTGGAHGPETAYAQHPAETVVESRSGRVVELDCTGLACPGPIMRLSETMDGLAIGDEVAVRVSDPGFGHDAPAWASAGGHDLISLEPEGPGFRAVIRKGAPGSTARQDTGREGLSFVVFSGDLDKVLAAFIIANGALTMGKDVSMFFTFWGLNALRRSDAPRGDKSSMDRLFAAMMPSGAGHLSLSQMHLGGAGTAMIKKVMRDHQVPSLPELIHAAQGAGAQLTACTMTMDLLGIAEQDLIDGVGLGGVASFLAASDRSGATLFI